MSLPNGATIPALGMGTWYMGEAPSRHDTELAALRTGIEIGLTLIDTAVRRLSTTAGCWITPRCWTWRESRA